jgi:hypothetical protein
MNCNKQKNKVILLDQTFLNDKGKRREPVVKVKERLLALVCDLFSFSSKVIKMFILV